MKIDIPDSLYDQYKRLIEERYLSDDVSEYVQQLIEIELQKSCAPGRETDAMTKCKTRYQLEQDINRATFGSSWQDHSAYTNKYVCIDIDNFKKFLDVYSLSTGDEVLQEIGSLLRADYGDANVFRFGGDEFVVQLGEEDYRPLQLAWDVTLKHSVVKVSAQRNQHRNHYINRVIMFHLDKGIVESTSAGHEIICQIGAT